MWNSRGSEFNIYKMIAYIQNQFNNDLKQLSIRRPNSTILKYSNDFKVDIETVFWGGGRDWKNVKEDTKNIAEKDLENFLLCLFSITILDIGIFSQFGGINSADYQKFRKTTYYPKFGWSGFGLHYDNPKKILKVPEELMLIEFKSIKDSPLHFSLFFKSLCDKTFEQLSDNLTTEIFICNLINDEDFKLTENDRGTIYEVVFESILKIIAD